MNYKDREDNIKMQLLSGSPVTWKGKAHSSIQKATTAEWATEVRSSALSAWRISCTATRRSAYSCVVS